MTHVLVVDDNEPNRYLLHALLGATGFRVDSAADGRQALAAAALDPPDLVVSDVLMPGMDGFALCRAWHRDERLKTVPFVFYTATYTADKDAAFGISLGAADYLHKPEEPAVLVAKLRAILARRTAHPPAAEALPEAEFLREYNQTLIHKLEDKMIELERTNRDLAAEVAERRRTEARVRDQARLLDLASDAIIGLGRDHVVCYWNRGAERVFGWPEADAVGTPWAERLGPLPPHAADVLAADPAGPEDWTWELVLPNRAGQSVVVNTRWTVVAEPAGRTALLVVATDITDKKRLEAQFLRSQRMEVIGTLASGLAHDLNNILTPIAVAAPMLRRVVTPDAGGGDLLRAIESSAERAAGVLRQLLAFGRGAGRPADPVDLAAVAGEVGHIVRETFPKSVRVATTTGGPAWVRGDPTQLHQLLLNLCINARDAMPDGGQLTNAVQDMPADPPRVRLSVADTGTGSPAADLADIFDPFFTTTEVGLGTGLGLFTVQTIAKNHGGTVHVVSRVGHGTRFEIDLPAVPPDAPPAADPAPGDDRPARVLVVDDDPAIRDITEALLRFRGYDVAVAATALDALVQLNRPGLPVAAVLIDLVMPHIDGVSFIRTLRDRDPGLAVVAMSGLPAGTYGAELTGLGVRHFLAKPFTGEQLLAALEAAVAESVVHELR